MNHIYYFEIQAENPERAIAFYSNILGWEFTKMANFPIDYWSIQTEGMPGGLLKRPTATPPPMHGTNAYVNSMQVEHFDDTARSILATGGQVAMAKFAVRGKCWQGYFLDTEGNTFGLFQVDESAK